MEGGFRYNPEKEYEPTEPNPEDLEVAKEVEEVEEVEEGVEHIRSLERMKIKPTLTIIIPEGFELEKEEYEDTIRGLASRRVGSIEELRKRGWEYSNGKKVYPTPMEIFMRQIEGTETHHGWKGLIEGVEEVNPPIARLQTLEQSFKYAQQILKMKKEERNELLSGIDLAMLENWGSNQYFVDADGRHRILTFKVLAEMGCTISISGVKVTRLERQ